MFCCVMPASISRPLLSVHRNRTSGGGIGLYDDDDDDDDEFGPGMLGFTGSECYELMSQGVKPWDDDAGDVLAVLNGDYYW